MIENLKIPQLDPIESNLPPGISFICGVYWFILFCAFVTVLTKVLDNESSNDILWVEILPSAVVTLAVLLGFYKKKSWVVPLILINATWRFIDQFYQLLVGDTVINAKFFTHKLIHLMFAIFCIYQIFIFTRRETKAYFQWKCK
jgi:uncharacterized membrane protein YwaF